jgi:uncharacterized glyoxalase superfamily protein PhnB
VADGGPWPAPPTEGQIVTEGRGKLTGLQARLGYDDEVASLQFLTDAFALREQARIDDNPDGGVTAWLDFGESTVMIGRAGPLNNLYSPKSTGQPTAEMNVIVDEIDAHYARAVAAGAHVVAPLEDARFGQRHYEATDPEGHIWHFMKPLVDVSNQEHTQERIEPRLSYDDEVAAIDFLSGSFGFQETASMKGPEGDVMAWLGLGAGLLMIGRSDPVHGLHSPRGNSQPTAMINVEVPDVDAHHDRALAGGAHIVTELGDTPWGYRRYEALDPEGNRWLTKPPFPTESTHRRIPDLGSPRPIRHSRVYTNSHRLPVSDFMHFISGIVGHRSDIRDG